MTLLKSKTLGSTLFLRFDGCGGEVRVAAKKAPECAGFGSVCEARPQVAYPDMRLWL
jgi:hypothetical protein